jgi:glycosyltransferase involved in cell wall biosynthesis
MLKFSIITINYNNLVGLEKTFQSVISQNCDFAEYLIIDGGSTDGSDEFIRSHADRLCYWVSEPDNGVYHAMNKGICHATGEYCLFMNAGDVFYSDHVLNDVKDCLNQNKADFLVGNTLYVDQFGKEKWHRISPSIITASLLFSTALCHQSTFIKREILLDEPYDETLKYVSDWKHMFHQIVFQNRSYQKLDFYVSIYDFTGMSSTNVQGVADERRNYLQQCLPKLIYKDYEYYTDYKLVLLDRKKSRVLYDFVQIFLSKDKWYSVKVFLYNLLFHR